jgi:alkylation response protein AidB-like acyl-CoA dehydrogenase
VAIVFAIADPAVSKRRISAFIVPTATPGYTVARLEDKMGQHSSDTPQISYERVRVPDPQRSGDAGAGYRIALSSLEAGRIGIAAQNLGMARAALYVALASGKQRESFGLPIFQN